MATIPQMMPSDIYSLFISRIGKTNMLYNSCFALANYTIEMEKTIYFKYYFDVSTAIEAVLRGIAYEESKKNNYINYLVKPSTGSKSFFIPYEELSALINFNDLYNGVSQSNFKTTIIDKVSILKTHSITKRFVRSEIENDYELIRNIRNVLAHGLGATSNASFDQSTLETFLYVLYLLLKYYIKMFPHLSLAI